MSSGSAPGFSGEPDSEGVDCSAGRDEAEELADEVVEELAEDVADEDADGVVTGCAGPVLTSRFTAVPGSRLLPTS